VLIELLIVIMAVPALIYFSLEISKKYESFSIFVSLIFIIFWSLAGAIPLLLGKLFNGENTPIFILEQELFVIIPDLDYFYTLFSYILFISCLLYFLWRAQPYLEPRFQTLSKHSWQKFADNFPHFFLLIFNGIVAVLLILNLNALEIAAGDLPIYLTENRVPSRVIDYARTGLLFSTALGSILLVIGFSATQRKKNLFALLYLIVFVLACYPFWISGARNTVFLTMAGLVVGTFSLKIFSGHSFLQNLLELKLVIVLVLIAFLCISITSTTRGISLSDESMNSQTITVVPGSDASTVVPENEVEARSDFMIKSSAILQALKSKSSYIDWVGRGEILDSHASLYGVITKMNQGPNIEFENSYNRYAKIVGAAGTKGYTINPVAALWMNIGIFAPFVAGGYFSLVILFFWCISRMPPRKIWHVIALPSIAFSSAAIPVILSRSGPEGLWGLFINIIFLPGLFLFIPMVRALSKTRV
jgi:hypothetical protein